MIEYSPTMSEAIGSNTSITEKKKQREREGRKERRKKRKRESYLNYNTVVQTTW